MVFFILSLEAVIKKKIRFDFANSGVLGKIIGTAAFSAGFYYLHWVHSPIYINALLYSPLGIVNFPTMATFCGFLIFRETSEISFLDLFVGLITLYFGFFGVMRLEAYIDVVLIISGAYLLVRQASFMNIE
jgi:hypothetical protein